MRRKVTVSRGALELTLNPMKDRIEGYRKLMDDDIRVKYPDLYEHHRKERCELIRAYNEIARAINCAEINEEEI